jgi:hypothetical protein
MCEQNLAAKGQNAKYSSRVDVFRFVSKLRRGSMRSALRICAMCGRLRVGKSFFHVLQHWSVQPCVDGSGLARAFFTFCSIGRCSHVFGLLMRFT